MHRCEIFTSVESRCINHLQRAYTRIVYLSQRMNSFSLKDSLLVYCRRNVMNNI